MSVYQNVYYCDENQTNYFFQINGFNTEQLNYIIKDKIQKQNKFENRPKNDNYTVGQFNFYLAI